MSDDITLRVDRTTAEDLYAALHETGEHIAAGSPIAPPTAEAAERLGRRFHVGGPYVAAIGC